MAAHLDAGVAGQLGLHVDLEQEVRERALGHQEALPSTADPSEDRTVVRLVDRVAEDAPAGQRVAVEEHDGIADLRAPAADEMTGLVPVQHQQGAGLAPELPGMRPLGPRPACASGGGHA